MTKTIFVVLFLEINFLTKTIFVVLFLEINFLTKNIFGPKCLHFFVGLKKRENLRLLWLLYPRVCIEQLFIDLFHGCHLPTVGTLHFYLMH